MSRAYSTKIDHVRKRVLNACSKVMPDPSIYPSEKDLHIYRALRALIGYADLREMRTYVEKPGKFNVKEVKRDCMMLGIPEERVDKAIEELRVRGCTMYGGRKRKEKSQ
jgi:hypothetical protein